MWNKMMEDKARIKKQNCKKGLKRMGMPGTACREEGVFDVSETTASPYLKLACLTWINSSYLDASSDVSL